MSNFDEEPLPVAVADRAYQRQLDLVASLDFRARTAGLPISIVLQRATSGIDRVKPQQAGRRGHSRV
jgi:nitrate reductase alpha subunit